MIDTYNKRTYNCQSDKKHGHRIVLSPLALQRLAIFYAAIIICISIWVLFPEEKSGAHINHDWYLDPKIPRPEEEFLDKNHKTIYFEGFSDGFYSKNFMIGNKIRQEINDYCPWYQGNISIIQDQPWPAWKRKNADFYVVDFKSVTKQLDFFGKPAALYSMVPVNALEKYYGENYQDFIEALRNFNYFFRG